MKRGENLGNAANPSGTSCHGRSTTPVTYRGMNILGGDMRATTMGFTRSIDSVMNPAYSDGFPKNVFITVICVSPIGSELRILFRRQRQAQRSLRETVLQKHPPSRLFMSLTCQQSSFFW